MSCPTRIATTTKRSIRKFKPEEENLTDENIRFDIKLISLVKLELYNVVFGN